MWWRDLANRYAHGVPMPWHRVILMRCERCGGTVFQVLMWDRFEEERGVILRYVLECGGCGAVEANITETIGVW